MTVEKEIIGHKTGALGRAPGRFPSDRVCAGADCSTRLSVYNRKETCFRHSPTRYPRIRGSVKHQVDDTPLA
jgi:hypothetical protein